MVWLCNRSRALGSSPSSEGQSTWASEEGDEPKALDLLHNHTIDMVVNIPKNLTSSELSNGYKIRRAAIDLNVPLITNARLASAFIYAFCTTKLEDIGIKAWNEY